MLLKELETLITSQVSPKLAIPNDFIGFMDDYDTSQNIENIKIFMDIYPKYDNDLEKTLILTHHKPLFTPKTPTYVLHSNWDVINGGSNDALAKSLDLKVVDVFDKNLGIGRICEPEDKNSFLDNLKSRFKEIRMVGELNKLNRIGIISGFGLKNPNYVRLAKDRNVDTLISGDLTQETAVLAINEGISLIDLGHHNSEVPGLLKLKELFKDCNLNVEVVNQPPWESL
ncbi:MAG: Nif3-like dinuclear metal center hexameric protein [Methanobrevibacter sp.]|uniref:Nif3-like dinuclear metal center hexameric protein n=1 Tax=Methanobrevibacter sp. TaxID=66852 RepID=UPI0026E0C8A6|nr:Nif3-like dinuclear metal center hexameric protein [Methanobrevibacter sp.]MDO5848404.1 Nif3-like dinuclear metal center hexameric protein [Methanobrevibacter sp.]